MPDTTSQNNKQSGSTKNVVATIITIIILCIIGFLVWWFGWHNSNNPITNSTVGNNNQTTQPTATEKKQTIKTNWAKFFDGTTPATEKINLLQNGQQFAPIIKEMASSKTAKATSATVSKVDLKTNTTASVTYTINIDKHPALQNQTGQAILVNGTWKVSDQAFCNLLSLQGTTPPNCPKANGTTKPSGSEGATGSQPTQPSGTGSLTQQQTTPQTSTKNQ